MTLLLLLAFLSLAACGKKGPPTLKAYEKPEKPSNLTAIHRERKIILSWSYPGDLRSSVKGFEVLRSEGKGFERRAFVESDQSFFEDGEFDVNVSYGYKVVAENLKGVLSTDSDTITVAPKPLPLPPTDVRFAVKSDAVELSWKRSGEDVCYNIYKSMEKGRYGKVSLNREPVCGAVFRDTSMLPERTVYYTFTALHNTPLKDEGFHSGEVVVTPADFVPSPPSELSTVKTDERVYLVWKESPDTWVKGYRVYRKREGEEVSMLLGEARTPTFVDKEKSEKKTWYMIRAVGPSSESQPVTIEVP
ncbi:MAG TPA: hypothetical protein VN328_07850 [Thermodesulfovibrionales bacterium]|nr:hypothetical protein [Thermodesulfovibrionales bacterium]